MDGALAGDGTPDTDTDTESGADELGPVPCPVCDCEPGERAEYEHGDGVWFIRIPCGCDCHDPGDGWWYGWDGW